MRHDPEAAHHLAEEWREARHLHIDVRDTSLSGLTPVTGRIDLPDALDLEAAVSHTAEQPAAWGSDDSVDVRRARALGDLARQHLAWYGEQTPPMGIGDTWMAHPGGTGAAHRSAPAAEPACGPASGSVSSPDEADAPRTAAGPRWQVKPRRQVVLYVHLGESDLRGGRHTDVGRVESTGAPVTAETIREWCGDSSTRLSARPVLDLATSLHADSYEVPERLREQIRLRDGTCVLPGCRAPGLHCQDDHIEPYDHGDPSRGGPTHTENLALLCQRHHTLKTHHGFGYTRLASGVVLWRTPHGLRVRRNPDGTTDDVAGLPDDASSPGGPGRPRCPGARRRRRTRTLTPPAPHPARSCRVAGVPDHPVRGRWRPTTSRSRHVPRQHHPTGERPRLGQVQLDRPLEAREERRAPADDRGVGDDHVLVHQAGAHRRGGQRGRRRPP